MSLTGISRLWDLTVKTRDKVLTRAIAAREKRLAQLKMKKRHSILEPLEERHLLSLTIGSVDDVVVNTEWQDIRGEVAADVNASNDVVVAWTAADQMTDPVTGEAIGEDLNIYARYLTDETQVVTVAIETSQIGKGASFELTYGAAAVQRLSFFTSTPTASNAETIEYDAETGKYVQTPNTAITGDVTLNLNGTDFTFQIDTSLTPTVNAQNIQSAIRSLGSDFAKVEVSAYSETEFDITYYGDTLAGTVPDLTLTSQNYQAGATPSVLIETISSPTTITNYSLLTGKQIGITITSDTANMASQIEKAFERTASDAYYAPVMRLWHYDPETQCYVVETTRSTHDLESAFRADTSYDHYITRVFPDIEVNVTALDSKVDGDFTYFRFEVTFTGNSGYKNHQELVVSSLYVGGTEMIEKGENGYLYVNGADAAMNGQSLVETIKESSPVFRVNSVEPAAYALDDDGNVIRDKNGDPVLTGTGKTDQYNPAVCFADNGTFVVAWQSDIDETFDRFNYSDIFARRFTIQGYANDESKISFYADGSTDGVPLANVDPYLANVDSVKAVQCVRPLGEAFLVNTETNGTQELPSISCDAEGNFVVAWTSDSQWNSYFAGIVAAWFDKSGLGITGDVIVTESDPTLSEYGTPTYGEAYAAMGLDGVTVIAWTEFSSLYKSVYGANQYKPFVEKTLVADEAFSPSVDFDNNGHYVLSWTATNGPFNENLDRRSFSTVMAELFEVTKDEFYVYTEASLGSGDVASTEGELPGESLYVLNVGNMSVGMDADGDMFFAYQGFGYDVQAVDDGANNVNEKAQGTYVFLSWEEVQAILEKTGNEDLAPYFEAWFGKGSSSSKYAYTNYLSSKTIVDLSESSTTESVIEDGDGSPYGFVDPDDYIKAALSSFQRQMKETLYEESYKDYFANELDIIHNLYEKWAQKYDELLAETKEEWTEKFFELFPSVKDMSIDDFLDDATVVTDPSSDYYGMTYAEVARLFTDESSSEYLSFFEAALRSELETYYENDTTIEQTWRETLSHIYSGEELDRKVKEKVAEVITESIEGNLQALENYLKANPGKTPRQALTTLIKSGVIPDVEWDFFQTSLRDSLTKYYKSDRTVDPATIPALVSADVTTLKEYMADTGCDAETALKELIDAEILPAVTVETFWAQPGKLINQALIQLKVNDYLAENGGKIHIETLKKIDEKVRTDLTSTYKEAYDAILQQKTDNIAETLDDWTYEDFAESTQKVTNPASKYYGMTYAEATKDIYDEEYAKWPQPGSPEYQEGYEAIFDELYDQNFEEYYEKYWEELRPEYTHAGVVDYIGLAKAATEKAEETISDEAYDKTDEWAFRQLFEDALRKEEAETGAIREELRLIPDTELREMYLEYYTRKHPELTEKEIAKAVNLAPVLRMINELVDDKIAQEAQILADAARSDKGTIADDAESIIKERTRQRMISEVAAEDAIYAEYLAQELESALTIYHTDAIAKYLDGPDPNFGTRREGLLNQYKEFLNSTKKVQFNKTYTAAVKDQLMNLIYCSEDYCGKYSAVKDDALDEFYGARIRGFFTDSAGNMSEEAEAEWKAAVENASRFEKIWTLAYDDMVDSFDSTIASVISDSVMNTLKRKTDEGGKNCYQAEIDALKEEYNVNYYNTWYTSDFAELKNAYRELLIPQYADDAELEGRMAEVAADTEANRKTMAEALAKADLAEEYRAYCYQQEAAKIADANMETDAELQEYADTVVLNYNANFATEYRTLIKDFNTYLVDELHYTEEEAADIIEFYAEESDGNRIVISYRLATYYAQKTTNYDQNRAETFDEAFLQNLGAIDSKAADPEEAAEAAIEKVKETYADSMYSTVDLLALEWNTQSATLDDVITALSTNRVDIKYKGLVQKETDAVVSNMIYNAVHYYTGDEFLMNDYSKMDGRTSEIQVSVNIPALFETIFTKWITWSETKQAKEEIRAEQETELFNALRGDVVNEKYDEYKKELEPRFTDADGNVDQWSLEQAVQKAIDVETTKRVDEAVTAEAEARIDETEVAQQVQVWMSPDTDILGSVVTIDYDEISASAKKIVPVLIDAEITTEAWTLVDNETDRLIGLRVNDDLSVWAGVDSSDAQRQEVVDRANSVLEGTTVEELAEQDMENRTVYADDEIHKEVQSSIIYDGLYSIYYNRYHDSLLESLGKERSYQDLLTDDDSTFEANEFSAWYGMTYADICSYLTQEYTAQYPELSASEIENKVKGTMLEWVLVPDELHRMTMEQVEGAAELVVYGDVYEEMYELNAEGVADTIYEEIHDEMFETLYAKYHDALYAKYYPEELVNAHDEVAAEIKTTYADEVAKAAEEAGMSVDDYVEKVIDDAENGIMPEWLPEGGTIRVPSKVAEENTESRIASYLNGLIHNIAADKVVDSGIIDEMTQAKVDALIEEAVYEIIENDPYYVAKKADVIGRANAVMEYNLQYLRGEGNGIYFTTYTANFTETDNDVVYSNGIVNAQRDGNNQKYFIGIPKTNISSGTLALDIVWEGNWGDSAATTVSLAVVIDTEDDTPVLNIDDTISAMTDAFTAAAGEFADWQDGMFQSVQIVNVSNTQLLFEGTDWSWDNYINILGGKSVSESIADSMYWKDDYVIFEVTFQGGAHDSVVSLYFNEDSSNLVYAIDNDYYDVLTTLKDNAGVKINDVEIEVSARVHDLLATRVSGSVYYDDCMKALKELYSGLDGESTFGELVAELFSGEKTMTTTVFNTFKRCMNTIDYDQYDFYTDLKALLDNQVVREGNAEHLFNILTYVTDSGYASGTFRNFYEMIRHFYVPREEDDNPKSHSTVISVDAEGNTTVDWGSDSWLSGDVDMAYTSLNDILNPDSDVLKYEYILAKTLTGNRGTRQINATVGMNDSGNVTVVWQQQRSLDEYTVTVNEDGTYSYTKKSSNNAVNYYGDSVAQAGKLSTQTQCSQVYLRSFIESTDYAGARVTSVLLPNGEQISDGDTVTTATKNLVVTFTENLQTTNAGYSKLHAVDNPDNWKVLKDGVLLQNVIENITFSMSASRFEAEESDDQRINGSDNNPDSLIYGSNQYEAVITFKDGFELTEGSYTLVATNMIHDIAGNAINSNGNSINKNDKVTARDGFNTEVSFTVVPLDQPLAFGDIENENFGTWGKEHKVDDTVGSNTAQWTTEELLDDTENYTANSPDSVATDAGGNFVTVWTQTTKNEDGVTVSGGIYFKIIRNEYVVDADGFRRAREISSYESQAVYFELDGTAYHYYSDATKATELFLGCNGGGIDIADFEVPQQASVAMDDDGNFVIVWDMLAADDQLGFQVSRDVFVRRYSLSGSELGVNGYLLPYRVNIVTEYDQQNASVAMDADGDFVVVWESWDQDGSGWGIYGRRFDDTGYSFGRSNTVDIITFTGEFAEKGNYMDISFTDIDGTKYQISGIQLSEAVTKSCESIKSSLLELKDSEGNYVFWNGVMGEGYEEYVTVTRHGMNSINIEFTGSKYAYQDIEDIRSIVYDAPEVGVTEGGTPSLTLKANVARYSTGVGGTEFSVNETVLGDQRFASVGMNSEGTFVVTWTSWGQDADDAVESNIYARQFVSNHSLISTSVTVTTPTSYGATPTIATLDDVTNHVGDSVREYTGVAYVGIGSPNMRKVTNGNDDNDSGTTTSGDGDTAEYGTGELLSTGYHVLTAAHLVFGTGNSEAGIDPSTVYVSFVNTAGDIFTYTAKEIYVHPDYTGNYLTEADIAIIVLDECVDSSITRYDIYRDSDEMDQAFTMVGFGTTSQRKKDNERVENEDDDTNNNNDNNNGEGDEETVVSKHFGMNTFDLYGTDISAGYNYNTLLFDFDDGTRKNDTFGNSYGVVNRGLGNNETMAALGDSGGPCFIDGKVAGVISWSDSATPGKPIPGDYAAAVRVSAYADWIDMICAGITTKEFLVNTVHVSVVTTGAAGEDAANGDNGGNTDTEGNELGALTENDKYQEGVQIWSDVAVDSKGNFVVTWTSFNQDGYGDTASGGSSNGLGGIYMRRYYHETEYELETDVNDETNNSTTTTTASSGNVVYYFPRTGTVKTQYVSDVTLVNEYTGYDQIKPKVDMDADGNFVIAWSSYENRVYGIETPVADGIYARQYINTSAYYEALAEYYGITVDDEGNTTVTRGNNSDTTNTDNTAGGTTATSGKTRLASDGDANASGSGSGTSSGTSTGAGSGNGGTADTGTGSGTTTDTDNGNSGRNGGTGTGDADDADSNVLSATGNFAEITEWTRGNFPVSEEFRHANVDIKTGAIGGAFKVNALTSEELNSSVLDNQRGGSVALDENGDMIFVWTDLNDITTPDDWDARVMWRTVTKSEEDVPPTVTSVTAAFGDPGTGAYEFSNVSLMGDTVTFAENHGPSAVIYTFSELMYAKDFILQLYKDVLLDDSDYVNSEHLTTLYSSQDSTTRSVLNRNNWTMLCNNIGVASSEIDTIYYGLNAGYKLGYSVSESEQYELVIVFTEQLQKGAYSITVKDAVTDLSKNKLDGNYDGKEGGSFTVRFNVGVNGVPSPYDDDEDEADDDEAFTHQNVNHIDPEVVTFADGSYIIVTETNNDYLDSDDSNGNNNNNNNNGNNSDNENDYTSDIVIRKFNAAGEPDSADITVNSYHEGIQEDPDIDGYDYENYAVVWTGEGEKGNGVYARFYNSGAKKTEEVRVNDVYLNGSNNHTFSAQVAFDDSCDAYLVTWRQQKGANYVILGKYFSIAGTQLSRQFVVAESTYQSIDHYYVRCQNGYYGIAWSEYIIGTNTTEVFGKTFTKTLGAWNVTDASPTYRVNETTSGSQYQVCADLDNYGNFYVVWTSTQNLATTDWDIYTRSFTFSGMPRIHETKVNQISFYDPFDSRQCEPYISVEENGLGYVVTWSSKNTEGINYDIDLREQLFDYGVMGCAFNAFGESINIDTGEVQNPYDATFVANKILNGDQRNSVVSVYGWDNGVPQFVVAWEGPLKVYTDDNDTGNDTDNGDDEGGTITPIADNNNNRTNRNNGTNGDDEDLNYDEYTMVFHRAFPKRSSAQVADIENALSSGSGATDLLMKDRLAGNASGTNGYYRPSNTEMVVVNAEDVMSVDTVEIAGTSGDDVLEVIADASGTSWAVYLNGAKVSGIAAGSRVIFKGNAGTDKIVYKGSASADSILINGADGTMRVSSAAGTFSAVSAELFDVAGGAGADMLTVYASGSGDQAVFGIGELTMTSAGRFSVTASSFENIALRGGSGDSAVLFDSKFSDSVLVKDGYLRFEGNGAVNEVYGVGNIRVVSENGGSDTASFEGVVSLVASQGQVVGKTASTLASVIGFSSVSVTGAENSTASLIGSKKADTFVSDAENSVLTYSGGQTVSLAGVKAISVNGNGGNDSAVLVGDNGVNTFTGRSGSASLAGNSYSRTVTGFAKVRVSRPDGSVNSVYKAAVYDSVMDDMIVEEGDTVAVDFGGQELYTLIAFDQVNAKKEMNEGLDTVVSDKGLNSAVFGDWN